MVPHLKVEEAIDHVLGEHACAVTGVPDEQRGERLVALYTRTDIEPGELWKRLSETELPRRWLPKRENICQVDALPMLGTGNLPGGKLDLRAVKDLARSLAPRTASADAM